MDLYHQWHGHGPPLVLISGLGGKGSSWHPFLERAALRYRVLTFDSRGSGASPALEGPTSIRALARDALALLDHTGIDHAPIVGRSMGGMIAQELALLAPERVSRLALVCTAGRSDPHLAAIFQLWAEMAERGVAPELRHRAQMAWCLGREFARDPACRQRYLERKASAPDRAADYALQARACGEHDALERLGALALPTLVVAGGDDRLMPASYSEELAAAIPGARLGCIPRAGHLAYLETPERFAALVLDFLAEETNDAGLRHAG